MLLYRLGLMTGWLALAGLLLLGAPASAQSDVKSATMDAVKKRGQLICGIDTGIPGYAFQDSPGRMAGPRRRAIAAPSPMRCWARRTR